jgi:hypothetical protein
MASETWSAILSGWPSVTDSEVNKKRSLNFKLLPIEGIQFGSPTAAIGWFKKRPWLNALKLVLNLAARPHSRRTCTGQA